MCIRDRGTLVGLVNMLKGMGADSSNLSSGMAVALITTFYGSVFSNVLFAPIASSLKNSHEPVSYTHLDARQYVNCRIMVLRRYLTA